jgi:hypothetical protein
MASTSLNLESQEEVADVDRGSRRAVLERLTALDDMVVLPTARAKLRHITEGWRTLLAAHQPTSRGRCPMCSGWWRSRKWPCQVWITAHNQLIGDGQVEQQPAPAPRGPARRPRDVEVVPRQAGRRDHEHESPAVPRMRDEAQPVRMGDEAQPVLPAIHRAAVIERRPTLPRPRRLHG